MCVDGRRWRGNIDFEGEMDKVTPGSEFIMERLMVDDDRPVYLQAWGGTNTIARALRSIEEAHQGASNWDQIYDAVSSKAVIYIILDQDVTYEKYISKSWPDVKVIYSRGQFWSFAYHWHRKIPTQWLPSMEGPWFEENILDGHGPLTAAYYTWGDGRTAPGEEEYEFTDPEKAHQKGRKQYDFISEGDSPAYLYLVDVGLQSLEDPSYGGWGGRFVQSSELPSRWEDNERAVDFNPFSGRNDPDFPQTRWITAIQNDFAARADWCVKTYEEANHAPKVILRGPSTVAARAGEEVELSIEVSDPDGDGIIYSWWQYHEADTYAGQVAIEGAKSETARLTIPADASVGETIHAIAGVTDDGTPALTRYARVVIVVSN